MYFNIPTNLVKLVRNDIYRSQWVNTSPHLKNPVGSPNDHFNDAASSASGPGHYDKYPVYKVHVAKNTVTNTYVRLWLWDTKDDAYVDVPSTAFAQGTVYDMYLKKYTLVDGSGNEITNQDANFILVGYRANAMPNTLI